MTYCWPLQPFDTAHPVRAYFNDPRIAGASEAFHFGIDISAPNGTPVYAVEAGVVHLEDARSIAVATGADAFGYWHVVPVVKHLQHVAQHELLGHVDAPWLHVHFAERRAGIYRNPLRAGALTPWADHTKPAVTSIAFSRGGTAVPPDRISGAVDVIVEAHDTPPIPVPPPWNDLPVTPARLRWRLTQGEAVVRPWHTPVDFSDALLPAAAFQRIYAPGTTQNRAGHPAILRFFLAHSWSTGTLADGTYSLEVEASDLDGNTGSRAQKLTVANDV
ncbi:MAG TPA: M23 family metallopeptidase [Gaiellaceae bacterium]|nr:M23 family metallopeptidase [Gaiellaceae bacterium]